MAQQFATVEFWIVVDGRGDTATGDTQEEAQERYTDNIGSLDESDGFRLVKVAVKVPLPEVCVIEIEATVPALEEPTAVA